MALMIVAVVAELVELGVKESMWHTLLIPMPCGRLNLLLA